MISTRVAARLSIYICQVSGVPHTALPESLVEPLQREVERAWIELKGTWLRRHLSCSVDSGSGSKAYIRGFDPRERTNEMPLTPAQTVTTFLQAFMSGDIDKARHMVSEDFSFQAPLHDGRGSKLAYFAGAETKARFIRAFRILRQWADGDDVSTVYELDIQTPEDTATMAMSEWHTVHAGLVTSTYMVFDSSARAARLLGNALGAHH